LRSGRRLAVFFFGGSFDVILGARATVEALRRGILDNQIGVTKKGIDTMEDIFTYHYKQSRYDKPYVRDGTHNNGCAFVSV
jgi:hypothetical protein